MSEYSIKQYLSEVEKIIHFGGTKKETAIRNAFYNLLNEYAKGKGLMVVPEVSIKTPAGKTVTPDGTLKDSLRQDWGYWESKDEADIIDDEIKKKFDKGYPKENILFEDSQTAVLFQNGIEIMRVKMRETAALDKLLNYFVNFERPEVTQFRKAIELFKQDIPKVTETLRGIIVAQEKSNPEFVKASATFLKICHDSINPDITFEDVREMMIQHILTEDIFNTIFDEVQFHRENNIARELEKVIITFFTGNTKRVALSSVQHYYLTINAAAAGIADHHEKQKFLKIVYETFYKSYNPKAADRLGVVYTPNEIVRFMVESINYLLNKHFNKSLEDKGVDILDPATGTGTFICDIIDFIRKDKLEYKFAEELHANEVAILPYYISNLNIEYTYKQKTGIYKEYVNLCFVDTLDNMSFRYKGKQADLFEPFTEENGIRIKRQNNKSISVVIGNPPYNANQQYYNDYNSNRQYTEIDKRIKDSYIKYSTATNLANLYDMYVRFIRWASDRLNENGIIAFVSNNSFINSRTFDGFRKAVGDEFNHCYILNLKGDARTSGERRRQEGGNIFSDQIRVGISIYFFTRKKEDIDCKIYYYSINDYATSEEKLQFISKLNLKDIPFELIRPDKNNNWIDIASSNFEDSLPLIDKSVKAGKVGNAILRTYSLGVASHRDNWVYDISKNNLEKKVRYLIEVYQNTISDDNFPLKNTIAWDRELNNYKGRKIEKVFEKGKIVVSLFRPFYKQYFYFDEHFNGMLYRFKELYNFSDSNLFIAVNREGNNKPFHCLASQNILDLHTTGDSQCLPFYYFDKKGEKFENITEWGLNQFITKYNAPEITKTQIFSYVYAIFHNPHYRDKYELNLKREFPRIPLYKDFFKWSSWGKHLMDLHIRYENIEPFKLNQITTDNRDQPKVKLKANKETGLVLLDENTSLAGIPPEAWNYKLGNRSALEWVLEQYKESKPKDPTVSEKFNNYKFADYKEHVIDLLKRVCTVSVETMKIIEEMKLEKE